MGRCKRWMVWVNRSTCVEDHWFPRATQSLGLRLREEVPSEERPDFLDQTHFRHRRAEGWGGKGRRGVVPEVGCSWKTERVVLWNSNANDNGLWLEGRPVWGGKKSSWEDQRNCWMSLCEVRGEKNLWIWKQLYGLSENQRLTVRKSIND